MTRTLCIVLAFFYALPATAGELVLYGPEESADTARAKVALFGGRTLANLQARTLTELVGEESLTVVGGATLTSCSGKPSVNADIASLLKEAEGALQFMEFESAAAHLEQAVAAELCLSEPLEAVQASRVHYLRGMVAVGTGNPAGAWPEFLQAALLNPDITWDDNFPPDGQTAFKGAVAATGAAEPQALNLVPAMEGPIWVNGVQAENGAELMLKSGKNLIQSGQDNLTTWKIELPEATNAAVIRTALVEDSQVTWASDAATRGQLEALLAHNSQGAVTYVSLPGQVLWQFEPATGVWSGLSGVTDAETPAENDAVADAAALPSAGTPKNRQVLYLAGGGGLTAVGGSLIAVAFSKKAQLTNGEFGLQYNNTAETLRDQANTLGKTGQVAGAMGLGLIGYGLLTQTNLGFTWQF
ncbi:MAG: hypothetical protein VX519_08565 [Myxococcota bacterium]|nr:hypothetical protein [Myxococcota bacterium]